MLALYNRLKISTRLCYSEFGVSLVERLVSIGVDSPVLRVDIPLNIYFDWYFGILHTSFSAILMLSIQERTMKNKIQVLCVNKILFYYRYEGNLDFKRRCEREEKLGVAEADEI